MSTKVNKFIQAHDSFLIVQADNPDADSLASALALEQILAGMDKETSMFCSVDIPTYLRYLKGWDRVSSEHPKGFSAVIIVDTTAINLFEAAAKSGALAWIKPKPTLIIDHHDTPSTIDFAELTCQKPAVACGELIFDLASEHKWPLSQTAKEMLAVAILSDSLGLISESTTVHSIEVIAKLVDGGVSLAKIDNERRQMQKKSQQILNYKGELIKRIEYGAGGKVAFINIPWEEIERYSHEYNPSMLVLDEMRQVKGVALAVAFKTYPSGRITAKVRANYGYPIAGKLAEHFGGGGHPYASGFRQINGPSYADVKAKVLELAKELIAKINQEDKSEAV
jgi:phosphoesterase RecJ-like protein